MEKKWMNRISDQEIFDRINNSEKKYITRYTKFENYTDQYVALRLSAMVEEGKLESCPLVSSKTGRRLFYRGYIIRQKP